MNERSNKIIKLDNVQSITKFLQQPTVKIAEGLTGVLASPIQDWKLSAGKIVQAIVKGSLLTQLGREFQYYINKGKIKEDYLATEKNRISFNELLKFIDEDVPDEISFNAMKSIFLRSISKKATKKDEVLAYQLMQICKKLSSGEILILKAAYNIANGKYRKEISESDLDIGRADLWFGIIAKQIGHGISELVEQQEESLSNLKLISRREAKPNYGQTSHDTFIRTVYFRLTSLGYKLCEFITKYEKIKK